MNSETVKVSIIIPIYKVEQYLEQCLDSIVNQTYKNIEIILINDGSPDNCGAICDRYAEKDSRIIVKHKLNEGLPSAIRDGLLLASGDKVVFVDSDDWVDIDIVECLVGISDDVEMATSDHVRYDRNGYTTQSSSDLPEGKYDIKTIKKMNFFSQINGMIMRTYRVSKIFDRELAVKTIQQCDLDVVVGEDQQFTYIFLLNCKKGIYISHKFAKYYYRYNPQSIMHSYIKDSVSKSFNMLDSIYNYALEYKIENLDSKINEDRLGKLFYALLNETNNENKKLRKNEIKKIMNYYKTYNLKTIKTKNRRMRLTSFVLRTNCFLIVNCFVFVMKVLRSRHEKKFNKMIKNAQE